jgi:hypothetical protein
VLADVETMRIHSIERLPFDLFSAAEAYFLPCSSLQSRAGARDITFHVTSIRTKRWQ